MAQLHISLSEFYDYTPIEIDYALKGYNNIIENQSRLSWEQTRLQIYYSYLLTPSNKTKVTYEEFKRTYIPLSFDKDYVDTPPMDEDTFDDIIKMFEQRDKKEGT